MLTRRISTNILRRKYGKWRSSSHSTLQKRRKDFHHPKGKHSHQKGNSIKPNRDLSKLECFTCDERGHYARDCPRNKNGSHKKKGNKRGHHAHTTMDNEPSTKRIKQESDDSSSDEEYVLISTLTRNITHGSNDWLIDSGDSRHMTGFKESFLKLSKHESPHKVKLGDDY